MLEYYLLNIFSLVNLYLLFYFSLIHYLLQIVVLMFMHLILTAYYENLSFLHEGINPSKKYKFSKKSIDLILLLYYLLIII